MIEDNLILLKGSALDRYISGLPKDQFDDSTFERYIHPGSQIRKNKKFNVDSVPDLNRFFEQVYHVFERTKDQNDILRLGVRSGYASCRNKGNTDDHVEPPLLPPTSLPSSLPSPASSVKYNKLLEKNKKLTNETKQQLSLYRNIKLKKRLESNSQSIYIILMCFLCVHLIKRKLLYTGVAFFFCSLLFSESILLFVIKKVYQSNIKRRLIEISSLLPEITHKSIMTIVLTQQDYNNLYYWIQYIINTLNATKPIDDVHNNKNYSVEQIARVRLELSNEMKRFHDRLLCYTINHSFCDFPWCSFYMQHIYPTIFTVKLVLFNLLPIGVKLRIGHIHLQKIFLGMWALVDHASDTEEITYKKSLIELFESNVITFSQLVKSLFTNIPYLVLSLLHYNLLIKWFSLQSIGAESIKNCSPNWKYIQKILINSLLQAKHVNKYTESICVLHLKNNMIEISETLRSIDSNDKSVISTPVHKILNHTTASPLYDGKSKPKEIEFVGSGLIDKTETTTEHSKMSEYECKVPSELDGNAFRIRTLQTTKNYIQKEIDQETKKEILAEITKRLKICRKNDAVYQ